MHDVENARGKNIVIQDTTVTERKTAILELIKIIRLKL
jgi:hypothetical protein